MGLPEREIAVVGTVRETLDGRVIVSAQANQQGKRIIRNGEAELEI
jgi:hypothetical protein